MDAAWRKAISEGLKRASKGIHDLNQKAIGVRDPLLAKGSSTLARISSKIDQFTGASARRDLANENKRLNNRAATFKASEVTRKAAIKAAVMAQPLNKKGAIPKSVVTNSVVSKPVSARSVFSKAASDAGRSFVKKVSSLKGSSTTAAEQMRKRRNYTKQ